MILLVFCLYRIRILLWVCIYFIRSLKTFYLVFFAKYNKHLNNLIFRCVLHISQICLLFYECLNTVCFCCYSAANKNLMGCCSEITMILFSALLKWYWDFYINHTRMWIEWCEVFSYGVKCQKIVFPRNLWIVGVWLEKMWWFLC